MVTAKELAALEAARLVTAQKPRSLGLGTGSTAEIFIRALARGKFGGTCLPTSEKSAALAKQLGLRVASPMELTSTELAVDGADHVFRMGPKLVAIKGYGGALFREKLVASNAGKFYIMVDEGKLEKKDFLIPVEVPRFAREFVLGRLGDAGFEPGLREKEGKAFVTDNGNFILDIPMKKGSEARLPKLELELKQMTGVLETGIFTKIDLVIVGKADGTVKHHS